MPTYRPYTRVADLPANANGDVTILEAHLDAAHGTITDVLEYLAQAVWSSGGVVIPGSVTNPSAALVRVQGRLGVTTDAKTLVAVADQSVDLASVASGTKCLVVISAAAGATTSHTFTDATTGESLTHNLLSAWGRLEVVEGDASNYPPLPDGGVPVARVTKTGAGTLTIDSVVTDAPVPRHGGGGATDFVGLTDTPGSYSGAGGKFVAVNSGATALEFVTAPSGGSTISINAQTGTSYTLVLADAGKLVTLNNASPVALTVPTNASVAFPVGTVIALAQLGAGLVSVAGASGVTINGTTPGDDDLTGQWATASLTKLATDTWLLSGGVA